MKTWLHAWLSVSVLRPWRVMLACLAFAALSGVLALGLEFHGDFAELLPEDTEEVRDLRFVEARAGGVGYLVVQVTGGDPETRKRFAHEWATAMQAEPDVTRYVEYHFDVDFFRTRGLLLLPAQELDSLRTDLSARITWERQRANPLFVDVSDEPPPATLAEIEARYTPPLSHGEDLESKDGSELYLYLKPRGGVTDLHFSRRMLATARRITEATLLHTPGLEVRFTGSYVIRVEEDDRMKTDLAAASSLSGLLALGIILLATRRLSSLLVVLAPVAAGIVFTIAIARLTIGHLNPITGFLAAVLLGLGIEYGVHLTMRYREERARLDVAGALEAAVMGTFNGALTSAFTNAAAFFVLVFAQFSAFRQFGFLASVGVLATLVSTYAMGPAVLVLSERLRFGAMERAQGEVETARTGWQPPSGALWALVVAIVSFASWSLFVARDVGFETNLLALRGKSPATELNVHINGQLGLIMNPALLHVETLEQARAVRRIVDERRGTTTAIERAASLDDFVPHDVEARLAAVARLRGLFDGLPERMKRGESGKKVARVRAMLDAKPWTVDELPAELQHRFMTQTGGGSLVLLYPHDPCFDTRELERWADALNAVVVAAREEGIPARVLDANRLSARIVRLVRGDGPPVMFGAAAAVFLMIWLSLRRLRDAVLVAVPLALGMVCLIGVMRLTGLSLNLFNIVLLPNLLSIAVDNSVHLFHRYREEGPGSLGHVVRTTGLAALVATLSNAGGYGALVIANHGGLRSIGWLAIAGVGCAFVGTTILFPSLLVLLERRRR
ncbi:MAG: MMPL family transporter [Myxococcales bacterium]|nr:MMPL family transporter [Myxococcales bacterium]